MKGGCGLANAFPYRSAGKAEKKFVNRITPHSQKTVELYKGRCISLHINNQNLFVFYCGEQFYYPYNIKTF